MLPLNRKISDVIGTIDDLTGLFNRRNSNESWSKAFSELEMKCREFIQIAESNSQVYFVLCFL
jgi:hypothetical protein